MEGLDLLGAISMLSRMSAAALPAPTPPPKPLNTAASTVLTAPPATTTSTASKAAASTVLTAPPAGKTVPPPDPNQKRNDAASQALSTQASTATSKAQKVLSLASKIKNSKVRNAITHSATAHINKAGTAKSKISNIQKTAGVKLGSYLIGSFAINVGTVPAFAMQVFDFAAAEKMINDMIAQGTQDDALATLTVDITDLTGYIDRLGKFPGLSSLVTSGNNILSQMSDLSTQYDLAGSDDPSLPKNVAALDSTYQKWLGTGQPGTAGYELGFAESGKPTALNPAGGSTTTTPPAGAPTVTSVTDSVTGATNTGAPGDMVVINGTNFTGTTAVTFGGVQALPFQVISATQIQTTVPQNAVTGTVAVVNPAGTASLATPFTVLPASASQPPPGSGGGGYGGGGGGGGGGGDDYPPDDGGGDDQGAPDQGAPDDGGGGGPAPEEADPTSVMYDPYADSAPDDSGGGGDDSGGDDSGGGEEDQGEGGGSDPLSALASMYMGHGGGGHGGGHGHGGHGHHDHGGGFGWGWYGPWDGDGLELLDITDVDEEMTVDNVVDAVVARLKEKQGGKAIIGAYDIAQSQRQMNTLKQVTVSIAKALAKHGLAVADETIIVAEGGLFQSELPGITSLKNTRGHLQWHSDKLAKLTDPTAMYDSSDDLKKWTMQAFIDANSVEEGRGRQEQIWEEMWTEIGEALASLPAKVATLVAELPGQIVKSVTGIPIWGWITGASVIVVLLGVGVYKILMKHGGTVAHIAARGYGLG